QSEPLERFSDFFFAGCQIPSFNRHLARSRYGPIAKCQLPSLPAQFECNIQNSCANLFQLGGLVFHFLSSKFFSRSLEATKPPFLFRAQDLHRIYSQTRPSIESQGSTSGAVRFIDS